MPSIGKIVASVFWDVVPYAPYSPDLSPSDKTNGKKDKPDEDVTADRNEYFDVEPMSLKGLNKNT